MRFWRTDTDIPPVVDLLCRSREERTWAVARRALEELCADPRFHHRALTALREATAVRPGHGSPHDLPPGVTWFLTGEARQSAHRPRTWLTAYLDEAGQEGRLHAEIATWVVEAFLTTTDPRARQDLFELLSSTDQPMLLRALDAVVERALEASYPRDHPDQVRRPALWTDGQPTPLMDVLLANPQLPLRPGAGRLGDVARAVLAVLKGRFDLAGGSAAGPDEEATARAMLVALELPVPETIAGRCRELLREQAPGPGREAVCERALDGNGEARAAALDAGYLPADERAHPLFLFATEQWDRYDRADPDGSLLREYCRGGIGLFARENVEAVAARAGRPNPCPPLPPRSETRPDTGHRGPIGSWPTSITGGFGGI
jgi:hypothetical protein